MSAFSELRARRISASVLDGGSKSVFMRTYRRSGYFVAWTFAGLPRRSEQESVARSPLRVAAAAAMLLLVWNVLRVMAYTSCDSVMLLALKSLSDSSSATNLQ